MKMKTGEEDGCAQPLPTMGMGRWGSVAGVGEEENITVWGGESANFVSLRFCVLDNNIYYIIKTTNNERLRFDIS
jgi:hypothetical protein